MNSLSCFYIMLFFITQIQSVTVADLIQAIKENDLKTVQHYVQSNPDLLRQPTMIPLPPPSSFYPLEAAASLETPDMMDLLLRLDEQSNNREKDEKKRTLLNISGSHPALHYALSKKRLDNVRYLLAHGADVHQCDAEGMTPLHIAMALTIPEVIDDLFQHGAETDIEKKSSKQTGNSTPLAWGIFYANVPTVKHLLAKGAKKDATIINEDEKINLPTYAKKLLEENCSQGCDSDETYSYSLIVKLLNSDSVND